MAWWPLKVAASDAISLAMAASFVKSWKRWHAPEWRRERRKEKQNSNKIKKDLNESGDRLGTQPQQ